MKIDLSTLIVTALLTTTSAFADLITFDDFEPDPMIGSIPSGYHGLEWNNILMTDSNTGGYLNGRISGTKSTYNNNSPATVTSGITFDFTSGYFTAAWSTGLQLDIIGRNGATVLYSDTFTLNTITPLFLMLNYNGVTEISFNSYGGTIPGYDGAGGRQFTMDNVTINGSNTVPDGSSTAACLATVLTAILAFGCRRT